MTPTHSKRKRSRRQETRAQAGIVAPDVTFNPRVILPNCASNWPNASVSFVRTVPTPETTGQIASVAASTESAIGFAQALRDRLRKVREAHVGPDLTTLTVTGNVGTASEPEPSASVPRLYGRSCALHGILVEIDREITRLEEL